MPRVVSHASLVRGRGADRPRRPHQSATPAGHSPTRHRVLAAHALPAPLAGAGGLCCRLMGAHFHMGRPRSRAPSCASIVHSAPVLLALVGCAVSLLSTCVWPMAVVGAEAAVRYDRARGGCQASRRPGTRVAVISRSGKEDALHCQGAAPLGDDACSRIQGGVPTDCALSPQPRRLARHGGHAHHRRAKLRYACATTRN